MPYGPRGFALDGLLHYPENRSFTCRNEAWLQVIDVKILFLHGWQSVPGGVKPTYLKDQGHEVLNPALPDDDFDAAVRIAQAEFDQYRPDVVVGSSRGRSSAGGEECLLNKTLNHPPPSKCH